MQFQGKNLFDVGTGSGILSIAALKLGALSVRAVDVDDVAVRVARENFERNGLTSRVETEVGTAADAGGRHWPVVVANILAHILTDIMPHLATALAPNGTLILSGLIAEQEADVVASATAHGLKITGRQMDEDWVALVAQPLVT